MAATALLKDASVVTSTPEETTKLEDLNQPQKFQTPEVVERMVNVEQSKGHLSQLMQVYEQVANFSHEIRKSFDGLRDNFVTRLKGIFGKHQELEADPVNTVSAALTELAEHDPAGGTNFKFVRSALGEATRQHAAKLGTRLVDLLDRKDLQALDRDLAIRNIRELNDAGLLGHKDIARLNNHTSASRKSLQQQLSQVEEQLRKLASNESDIFGDSDRPTPGNVLIEGMQLQLQHGGSVSEAGERLRKNFEQLVMQYSDMAAALERKRRDLYKQLDAGAQLLGSAAFTPEPIIDPSVTIGVKILAVRDCCQQLELFYRKTPKPKT